jgi:hypothetical protein
MSTDKREATGVIKRRLCIKINLSAGQGNELYIVDEKEDPLFGPGIEENPLSDLYTIRGKRYSRLIGPWRTFRGDQD